MLKEIIKRNKAGEGTGIVSICSAHPMVIRAGFADSGCYGAPVLIESTSNQVDQYGGYTGMKPRDFIAFVVELAEKAGFPRDRIIFGGDHLGPNRWQDLPAEEAMTRSRELVRSYAEAGFTKIHLDASMACADDPGGQHAALDDATVAARAADLCRVAEEEKKRSDPDGPELLYVIGTEVPVPGGLQEQEESVTPTSAEDFKTTVAVTKKAFLDNGLEEAWERVIAVVVQPGVEYGDDAVFDYDRPAALPLTREIKGYDGMVFEAHSTDYQKPSALKELVEDHFAVLKVGPWLSYAYREGLFALESIETELVNAGLLETTSNLSGVLEQTMMKNDGYWKKYYEGSEGEQALKRRFSMSDRCRYYWSREKPGKAVDKLIANLSLREIPLTLVSQYLPEQYAAVRDGSLSLTAENLLLHKIESVLDIYSVACGRTAASV